jgi:hypothetical protein
MSRRKDLDNVTYRKNRIAFLAEWQRPCHWCNKAPATTIDHLIEVDTGADPTDQGLWVGACSSCNSKRGTKYINDKRTRQQHQRAHQDT